MLSQIEIHYIQTIEEEILMYAKRSSQHANTHMIADAFEFLRSLHQNDRRRNSEPYIYHSLDVAKIVAGEIGLDDNSIVAAVLHEVMEDSEIPKRLLEEKFNRKTADLIDGLTKMTRVFKQQPTLGTKEGELIDLPKELEESFSRQAELLRKLMLVMVDDARILLIKLADRLSNVRNILTLSHEKQLKVCGENLFIFSPFAHRLGLFAIKNEMEELSFKFRHPKIYQQIENKIENTHEQNHSFIREFSDYVSKIIAKSGYKFTITGRPKSVYSIWRKIVTKKVTFEEVYDLLAIRIVFEPKSNVPEADQAWEIFRLINSEFPCHDERTRNWVSNTKSSGYEALHGTFLSRQNKWFEVQIRSERMHEIAERGYAAHWRYKSTTSEENDLDSWMTKVYKVIDSFKSNPNSVLDDFKLQFETNEILVFTPKGQALTLPKNSTVLDFAFEIHTNLGLKCIGAKVNLQAVNPSYHLRNGDMIEIITSNSAKPERFWLNLVHTNKAINSLKKALSIERKENIKAGKKIFESLLIELELKPTYHIFKKLLQNFKLYRKDEIYNDVAVNKIHTDEIKKVLANYSKTKVVRYWHAKPSVTQVIQTARNGETNRIKRYDLLRINDLDNSKIFKQFIFHKADCCRPIFTDEICFVHNNGELKLHKKECKIVQDKILQIPESVVVADWTKLKIESRLYSISLKGPETFQLMETVLRILCKYLFINVRAFKYESRDYTYIAKLDLYSIHNLFIWELGLDLEQIEGVSNLKISYPVDNKLDSTDQYISKRNKSQNTD